MKKLFTVMMAIAFAFSVAGFAVAAEKAAAPAAAPAVEKAPAAAPAAAPASEKKAPKAAKSLQMSGTIESIDAAAGTLTVKGKKGNVDLKAGEKVKLAGFKVGDKVVVKYSDGTASSVKKGKKAEPKAEAPKATPAAAPAAPAAAPAPAPVKK